MIDRRLAAGGMAEVFVATRLGPHGFSKTVALKRILPQFAGDPEFVTMFIEEARLAGKLAHPNVVQVFDFGEAGGDLYIAMELIVGSNVNLLLRAAAELHRGVPTDVALHIASQTAQALAYAHRQRSESGEQLGIVHRDVSPANILLTATGHVKLADFGIATVRERTRLTEDGHVRGKLGYMSPEQVVGRELDGRSDVFTLATVFTELLIAEPLFGVGSELDVLIRIRDVDLSALKGRRNDIPPDLLGLIERSLVKNPDDRPTASAFADACAEIIRRRGMGHLPERLSELLEELDLVATRPVDPDSFHPGSGTTAFGAHHDDATEGLLEDFVQTAPEIYEVLTRGEGVVGPLSHPKLVEMITSGEIHSGSYISKDGSGARLATDLPELARYLTSPALQWRLDEISRADRSGSLQGGHLLGEVWELSERKMTGVLHLWDGRRRKKIYFVDGRVEFVASTDRGELLGEYLVANDHCLRMEVEMGLALLPRYGGRLGDALVGLGVLSPLELFRALSKQVRQKLLEAFRWREGQWAFVSGERSFEESLPLAYEPQSLARDATAQIDLDTLQAWLEPYRDAVLHRNDSPSYALATYPLPASWARLLERVRGDATLSAILVRETASGRDDVLDIYRAFYLGLTTRLIRPYG